MLYKRTLKRLHKEYGVDYYNAKAVNSALKIALEVNEIIREDIATCNCFHNDILSYLLNASVINEDEYENYHNKPSTNGNLCSLFSLLYDKQNSCSEEKMLDIIHYAKEELASLIEYLGYEKCKNELQLDKCFHTEVLSRKNSLYIDLNENKRQIRALRYIKKKNDSVK